MTKFKPARAAAEAIVSGLPVPSDRLECTWYAPNTRRGSAAGALSWTVRGGSVRPMKSARAPAAPRMNCRKSAGRAGRKVPSSLRYDRYGRYSYPPYPVVPRALLGRGLEGVGFVGLLPGELGFGAAEVAERRGL